MLVNQTLVKLLSCPQIPELWPTLNPSQYVALLRTDWPQRKIVSDLCLIMLPFHPTPTHPGLSILVYTSLKKKSPFCLALETCIDLIIITNSPYCNSLFTVILCSNPFE